MRYWVVKGQPKRNPFEEWLRPGNRNRWVTRMPPKDWSREDRVFFWESSPRKRCVGLGRLLDTNASAPEGEDDEDHTFFEVEYLTEYFGSPLTMQALRRIKELEDASFLKAGPARTVLSLSDLEARAFYSCVIEANPEWAGVWPDLGGPGPRPRPRSTLPPEFIEGARTQILANRYERDPAAREVCLAAHGRKCWVCGFDFSVTYGSLGEGCIVVHHRFPIAARGGVEYQIDPVRDLVPICANCHLVVHRTGTGSGVRGGTLNPQGRERLEGLHGLANQDVWEQEDDVSSPVPSSDTRSRWVSMLRAHLALAQAKDPIPSRSTLTHAQEHQCRALGGHLIRWLQDWGPQLIRERNALPGFGEKDPFVLLVTDTPGLVAAAEILDPLPPTIAFCRASELATLPMSARDEDLTFHCELHSYFEPTLGADEESALRKRSHLPAGGSLWVHHDRTIMGRLFERGGRHLWLYDGVAPTLIEEGFTSWIA